jgi:hypothetical protein
MKKIFISAVLVSLLSIAATAQSKAIIINGKVTSFEESLPLEDVGVQVKGGSNSTGTQADGTFSLQVSPEDKILQLRLTGYETKEIPITKSKEYDIVLKRSNGIKIGNTAGIYRR